MKQTRSETMNIYFKENSDLGDCDCCNDEETTVCDHNGETLCRRCLTTTIINETVDEIREAAEEMDYSVREHQAGTGTIYMTCQIYDDDNEDEVIEVTVRVANHSECYVPDDGERKLLVSPDELTAAQAIERLRKPKNIERY